MSWISKILSLKVKKEYEITLRYHVIFWTIYFLFNTFRWGIYFNDYVYSLQTNIIGFPIHMTLCYLNVYVFMPKLVLQKKYLAFVFALISALFIMPKWLRYVPLLFHRLCCPG